MAKFVYFGVALSMILACCLADEVNFINCGSKVGTPSAVRVNGCTKDDARCTLKRNTNCTIEIDFTAGKSSQTSKAVVHGIVFEVPTPFPLPNPNVCSSGVTCPIEEGKKYTYSAELPILKAYPRVTVDIKWELQDDNNADFACIIIKAKLA